LFYIVTLLVFAFDSFIKHLVTSRLALGASTPIIKGIFHLTYVRNTGVAFGLFPDQRLFLVLIGLAVCSAVIYFYAKAKKEEVIFKFYLALILGGSLGNLYDRIFFGYVIDYLDIRVFPVFNFADVAINAGVLLVILDFLFRRK
jgi:signal peptidase II